MTNLFDRMKLLVQRDKEFRSALYDIMGFFPHNVELYRIAFAHKSQEYKSKKTGDRPLNNERLEFLGDAVLETVVSDIVYHNFKNKREGFLTNTRSKIVSRESLGKLAKDLGIDRLIQSHTSSKAHNSFLAGNAFEALMGAIYLDRGFDYAFRFIEHRIIGTVLDLERVAHKEVNFKSKLLEWSQKNRIRIDYKDKQLNTSDSANSPTFFTTIVLEGLFAGDGKGFSKKEAHQNASKEALTRMRREPKFIDEIFSSKEKRTAMEADPCFVLPVIDEIEDAIAREAEQKASRKADTPAARTEQPKAKKKAKAQKEKNSEKPADAPAGKDKNTTADKKREQAKPNELRKADKQDTTGKKSEAKGTEKPADAPTKADAPARKPEATKTKQKTVQPEAAPAATSTVIPIALETLDEETTTPAPQEVHTPAQQAADPSAPAATAAGHIAAADNAQSDAVATAATAAVGTASEEPHAPAPSETTAEPTDTTAETAEAEADAHQHKKARRRGKRQNAAAYANTETIPAETSHRAEKAAAKVEEAKKEKARKQAHKTARKAAKGIEETPADATAQTPAGNDATPANDAQPKAYNAQPARKPRRRRKTKAELPSETPNPEREQAINAAEEAAYRQPNTEE